MWELFCRRKQTNWSCKLLKIWFLQNLSNFWKIYGTSVKIRCELAILKQIEKRAQFGEIAPFLGRKKIRPLKSWMCISRSRFPIPFVCLIEFKKSIFFHRLGFTVAQKNTAKHKTQHLDTSLLRFDIIFRYTAPPPKDCAKSPARRIGTRVDHQIEKIL